MMSKNKGFAGFGDLVSDLSDLTATSERDSDSAPPSPPGIGHAGTCKAQKQSPESSAPPAASAGQTPNTGTPTGGSGAGWAVGIIAVIVVVLVIAAGGKGGSSAGSADYAPAASKPSISEYERAIRDLDPQLDRLLARMLDAAKAKDLQEVTKLAASVEKLNKPDASNGKAQVKEARSANALGLKALREQRKDVAVEHFFAAYRANPRDTEVVQNFGEALYETGDYSAAKKAFYSSLALTPKRWYAWISLGRYFARNNEVGKAAGAFALAFQFAKSPKAMRQAVLALFREDANTNVRNAARTFLADSYSSALPEILRPVLGNLADVKIPVLLPTKVTVLNSEGNKFDVVAVNNETYSIVATADAYRIPIASEPDCRASYCAVGMISGQKVSAADIAEEGEAVEVASGIPGRIIRDNYRNTSKIVFRLKDVEYTFAISAEAMNDVAAAGSAVRLGSIPTDVFAGRPKLEAVPEQMHYTPPAPTYAPPAPTYTSPPAPTYTPPPTTSSWGCTISYTVSLQTFGEGVNVELRTGTPGNSRVLSSSQSHGGTVRFGNLCPGTYFLAIGNGDSVSVTPVRAFESGVDYTSTLTMQRGIGNVSSRRKSDL